MTTSKNFDGGLFNKHEYFENAAGRYYTFIFHKR